MSASQWRWHHNDWQGWHQNEWCQSDVSAWRTDRMIDKASVTNARTHARTDWQDLEVFRLNSDLQSQQSYLVYIDCDVFPMALLCMQSFHLISSLLSGPLSWWSDSSPSYDGDGDVLSTSTDGCIERYIQRFILYRYVIGTLTSPGIHLSHWLVWL